MNTRLLNKYILRLIAKNGRYDGRQFRDGDYWIAEIEKYGYQSFGLAGQIISEPGGLSFHEYAPLTYQKMAELRQKDGLETVPGFAAAIKASCENSLKILEELHRENQAEKYSGAAFAFDALDAWLLL